MIPESYLFDQPTIANIIESDEVVQGYRALFSLFDWSRRLNDGKLNVPDKDHMAIQ